MHVKMAIFVLDERWGFISPSMGFKILGAPTRPQRIGYFYLWIQKTLFKKSIIL